MALPISSTTGLSFAKAIAAFTTDLSSYSSRLALTTTVAATIIQTNEKPLQSVDVDGVTVDLIESALRNAREEMDAVLFRTAMSPGIREQGDCFPMIANVEGKMVVGQFGSFIGPFLSAYDAEIELEIHPLQSLRGHLLK